MTSVWHLTSAHVPFDTRIFHKECRTLVEAGYDVTLVAPDAPRATVEGVHCLPLRRETNRWRRFVLQPLRIVREVRRGDPDICHFHDPDLLPVGFVLALAGRTIVYDSHEDLPKLVSHRTWIPKRARGPLARVIGFLERAMSRRFAAVISAEPAAALRFSSSPVVLRNLPLRREWEELPLVERTPGRLVYVGDITVARGALLMLDVLEHLSVTESDVSLLLGGKVADDLLEQMRSHPAWPLVDFRGWMDRDEVRRSLCSAEVGLVLLQPTSQYTTSTQPVKLYEYLAAGLLTVASDFTGFREAIGTIVGVRFTDPTDVEAVSATIRGVLGSSDALLEESEAARQQVLGDLTWENEASALLDLYRTLSARGHQTTS